MTSKRSRVKVDGRLRVLASGRAKAGPLLLQTSQGLRRLDGVAAEAVVAVLSAARKPISKAGLGRRGATEALVERLCELGALVDVEVEAAGGPMRAAEKPAVLVLPEGPCLYPRVLVLGGGKLGVAVQSALATCARDVSSRTPTVSAGRRRAVPTSDLFVAEGAPPSPSSLDWGSGSAGSGVDLVVFCPGTGSYRDLLAVRAMCERSGVRLLPLTVEGHGVEVGPLLLPEFSEGLERGRLRAVVDVPHLASRLGELPLFSDEDVAPEVAARAAELVAKVLRDPTHSSLERCYFVDLRGVSERLLPELPLGFAVPGKSFELDVEAHLHPRLRRPRLVADIRKALVAGELVYIREAFEDGYASALHAVLDAQEDWRVHEGHGAAFGYRYHQPAHRTAAFRALALMLSSEASLGFARRLTGARPSNIQGLSSSWYAPGDSATPHTDGSQRRQTAFVWHLARAWDEAWGGEFYWCPTGTPVPPAFNALTLFRVTHQSSHAVLPVTPQALGKRLSVFGWWEGEVPEGFRGRVLGARGVDAAGTVLALPSHPLRMI